MSLDTSDIARVLNANYIAAAKLLADAAREIEEAATAADQSQINLAIGAAIGAEAAAQQALTLIQAASAIRSPTSRTGR